MAGDHVKPVKKVDRIILSEDIRQLAKAVRWASEGEKILLLNHHNVPGGVCSGFRRGDFEFEAAFESGLSTEALSEIGMRKGASGREIALALERKLFDLGGEIIYKTKVRKLSSDGTGAVFAELTDGRIFMAESMSQVICPPDLPGDTDIFTVKVLLGLLIPYEQVRPAAEAVPGAEVRKGLTPGTSCVLSLSGSFSPETFQEADEENYFRLKDRLAKEITEDFERRSGLSLCGQISRIDVITPFTLARYISYNLSRHPFLSEPGNRLHPAVQYCKVLKVIDRGHAKSFVIGPDPERGTYSLAYFRAGQHVTITDRISDAVVCKPYSICSGPKDALGTENTTYTVMIERNPEGFFSPHALDTWEPGTKLTLSGPLGHFYYQQLRDARHVIALAGSSGVTPFFSMASAVADGIEDFDLTILYGSQTADTILLRDELDEIARRSGGKVRVIHVLSDEQREGYEFGFITPELIRKYAPAEDYSIFICGPGGMYQFLRKELPKLGLPEARIRFELPGEFGDPGEDPKYPRQAAGRVFRLTVRDHGREKQLTCRSDQTLMQAIERSGITIEANCRSGQCGWCRSRLVSGGVFVPETRDGRLSGDAENGWVHPCVTYPLSDLTLEIFSH